MRQTVYPEDEFALSYETGIAGYQPQVGATCGIILPPACGLAIELDRDPSIDPAILSLHAELETSI